MILFSLSIFFYLFLYTFLPSLYSLCFTVYFVWYEYCNSQFLFISICIKHFSIPSLFIFNWRMTVLQCCIGFCCIETQISHEYIHSLPLTPSSDPCRLSQSTRLSYRAASHYLFYTWWCVHVNGTISIHLTLFFLHCVHKIVFYIFVSRNALQIGSSAPFF